MRNKIINISGLIAMVSFSIFIILAQVYSVNHSIIFLKIGLLDVILFGLSFSIFLLTMIFEAIIIIKKLYKKWQSTKKQIK